MVPLALAAIIVLIVLAVAVAGAGVAVFVLCLTVLAPPRGVRARGGAPSEAFAPSTTLSAAQAVTGAPAAASRDLPPELRDAGLAPEVLSKVRVNPEVRGLPRNDDFLPAVGNPPALRALDAAISNGCVGAPSLYEQSRPAVVDGYAVRVFPKGWHIYKAFLGFLSEEQIRRFARDNPGRPSWLGDQYLTYAIARTDWGSVVSFRLEADLVLLDYFNPANLERLFAEIESLSAEFSRSRPAAQVVRSIRLATGFGMSPAEHLQALYDLYPVWRELWVYTAPRVPRRTSLHCHNRRVEGLNPLGAVREVHATDLAIFDVVLARHPAIDGLVRDSVLSMFDEAGVFYHEEFLVKGSAQLAKLRFDAEDPVCWVNWPLRDFAPPPGGIHLTYGVKKFASSDRVSPNTQFALARFYANHAAPPPPVASLPRAPLALFYNVHSFASLNADDPPMLGRVEKLVARYAARVEVVALAEVEGRAKTGDMLIRCGFPHVVVAVNGARDRSAMLVVAAKSPLTDVSIVDTAAGVPEYTRGRINPVHREQIVFTTREGLRGAAVHLEIGRRLVVGDEDVNAERQVLNSSLRITQLERLLKEKLDFIIGDFNFVLESAEANFLKERGFVPTHGDEQSTPYNRVDHFFARRELVEKLSANSNALISCNYSDHLPMVQTLPNLHS